VVQSFGLLTHGEKFESGVLFDLLIGDIVLLHVNFSTLEVFHCLSVCAEFLEGCLCVYILGSCGVASVHHDEDFFVATADLRLPGLADNLLNGAIICEFLFFLGDGGTLMEGSKLVVNEFFSKVLDLLLVSGGRGPVVLVLGGSEFVGS